MPLKAVLASFCTFVFSGLCQSRRQVAWPTYGPWAPPYSAFMQWSRHPASSPAGVWHGFENCCTQHSGCSELGRNRFMCVTQVQSCSNAWLNNKARRLASCSSSEDEIILALCTQHTVSERADVVEGAGCWVGSSLILCLLLVLLLVCDVNFTSQTCSFFFFCDPVNCVKISTFKGTCYFLLMFSIKGYT